MTSAAVWELSDRGDEVAVGDDATSRRFVDDAAQPKPLAVIGTVSLIDAAGEPAGRPRRRA